MASTAPSSSTMTATSPHGDHTVPAWLRNNVAIINHTPTTPCPCCNQVVNSTTCDGDDEASTDTTAIPGVLQGGYTPKKTLAEGYVHLKGSGKDWFGSRAWKARYARLVVATVNGVDVPLLLIYWYQSSLEPSTVITLDSTVVLPVEKDDKDVWNAFGLEVIHVTSHGEQRVTRTFTAGSQTSRDAWLLVLNQALLEYEKSKAQHRKQQNSAASTKKYNVHYPMEDVFVTSAKELKPLPPLSPPTSPRGSEKLPLPRPDVLAGESLLA